MNGQDKGDFSTPAIWADSRLLAGNVVRQLLVPEGSFKVDTTSAGVLLAVNCHGEWPAVIASEAVATDGLTVRLPVGKLTGGRLSSGSWVGSRTAAPPAEVLASFRGAFRLVASAPEDGEKGLRRPQLGAVHSVLGYWTSSHAQPATVVMPTGTGKTETMLALLGAARIPKLLVIVPSDALRTQIAQKFMTLGVLQELGVMANTALRPVVGQISHGFPDEDSAAEFASACNVIVTTPSALNACSVEARSVLTGAFSHLFVDEAHHIAARTWAEIRDEFADRPVVQFTATPFREDGRHLGGRIVYTFPLREAQKDGYFCPMRYVSVVDFDDPDRAAAAQALTQLRSDLAGGFDHILMARVSSIPRVKEVLPLYAELAPDLNPVALYSQQGTRSKAQALAALRDRSTRVIICVNMLGEGFDLPSLKVAAVHDAHKSLGVTLQFIGRFARSNAHLLGDATMFVARPDLGDDVNLRTLYSEDADWNVLLEDLSESAVQEQRELTEFEAAFGSLPEEVSLRNLLPKMSTVVYRVACDSWNPNAVIEYFGEENLLTVPIGLNERDHITWFVVEHRQHVRWGDIQTIQEVGFELFVIYWDERRNLLYINSSENEGFHEQLAAAVAGQDAGRVTGPEIYRVMAQIKRLVPTNVGVLDVRNRARRFSFHVGADVTEGFPTAEAQTKTQTNIFAYGYDNGNRSSVGASIKGRIWSHRVAMSLKQWMDWCDEVGGKVTDASISVDNVIASFIRPRTAEERPDLVMLAAEWPWEFYLGIADNVRLNYAGKAHTLIDVDLDAAAFAVTGPLRIAFRTASWSVEYDAAVGNGSVTYTPVGSEAQVTTARTQRPLSEFLNEHGLTLLFEQDLVLEPSGFLLRPDRSLPPFSLDLLESIDWTGIDLRTESQGPEHNPSSIQARAIEHINACGNWEVIVDDDGAGEIADIVALRTEGRHLVVLLVHCKYSSEDQPGARVEDLYDVCGQTAKSARWRREDAQVMLKNLIRRARQKQRRTGVSPFVVGDPAALYRLQEASRFLKPDFRIMIAQPGLSKAAVSKAQLNLLAAAQVYVAETASSSLHVLCSA